MKYLRKVFYIFPSNPWVLLPWVTLFILVSAMEVFGLGMLGPFVTMATSPEKLHQIDLLSFIYTYFHFKKEAEFIALIGILVILIFSFKSFLSWYVQSAIFKFSALQREKLVGRLMRAYLEAPYTFHLNKNSAQIIYTTTELTSDFSNGILRALMVVVSNTVMVLALSIMLCTVSPLAVASLLFTVLPLFLMFYMFKGKLYAWGQEMQEAGQGTVKSINHGLGGLKEVNVFRCGDFFREETVRQARRLANASIGYYGFKLMPRSLVETLLVFFLVGFISVSFLLGKDLENLTSTLSIFALGSIRLIPALTNLSNDLSGLRNASYGLNLLCLDLKELELLENSKSTKLEFFTNGKKVVDINFSSSIVLHNVFYKYPNASKNALNGISLRINKGESIALIGRSGAGKTTLADLILGLLLPQRGDILVDGISIYTNFRSWKDKLGYIPQSIFLLDDTIERNIAFGVPENLINPKQLQRAIEKAQLSEVVNNLPDGVHTRIGERGIMLSGGQRQRVGIARALYHEREILVLDEATSALDNETENLVTEAIQSLSGTMTIIVIAHRLTTIEHCDHVYVLDQGKLIDSGTYEQIVLASK